MKKILGIVAVAVIAFVGYFVAGGKDLTEATTAATEAVTQAATETAAAATTAATETAAAATTAATETAAAATDAAMGAMDGLKALTVETFDGAKVLEMIAGSSLSAEVKATLKTAVEAAVANKDQIPAVIAQIKAALGM